MKLRDKDFASIMASLFLRFLLSPPEPVPRFGTVPRRGSGLCQVRFSPHFLLFFRFGVTGLAVFAAFGIRESRT